MKSSRDKRRDLENLEQLYDTALERHKAMLNKFIKGKFKTTQIKDEHLGGLIVGDLKLLEQNRKQVSEELKKLTD